ncbi:MAG: ARMT1-like domain-containing protein [Desulfobulbaceae bacterium]|jgi:uncharacterized protein with ATP-grasp and redox domains|nr:ARMT1-like domain-containing protein [Desulfobulbaceae bacterium]
MKTDADCLPCYLRQALQTARLAGADEKTARGVVLAVAALLPTLTEGRTPPENSMAVYAKITELTGVADPYQAIKAASNREALTAVAALRPLLDQVENPLFLAIRFAIAGNIIDYGAAARFDVEAAFRRCRELPLAVDDGGPLMARIQALRDDEEVLYLCDNAGEIVYDRLLLEQIAKTKCRMAAVVKAGPIINDALVADAHVAGLGQYAEIIDNGAVCPGTPLALCSPDFRRRFARAALVIAKGQGNFESLSEGEREIFFLLTIKCSVVGTHLAELAGLPEALPGQGEMAVFRYGTS